MSVDPRLFEAWIHGRALSRGTPPPVAERGGYRIETGLAHETRRYVFKGICPELLEIAAAVTEPRVFLKAFVPAADMQAALPPRWWIQPPGYLMVRDGQSAGAKVLAGGYSLEAALEGDTTVVRVLAFDGTTAATGRAANCEGYRIYEQIVTEVEHRRRGLASAVIAALEPRGNEAPLLVATEAGRALYTALGWRVVSPYTSAVLPG